MSVAPVMYGRSYSLVAGVAGVPGWKWSDHQVSFEVTKTHRSSSNKATIKLFNISDEDVGFLKLPLTTVTLLAGYGANQGMIFHGDVVTRGVTSSWSGTDRVVTVEAGESEAAIRDTRVSISLGPGATSLQILTQIAAQMLVGPGNIAAQPVIPYLGGFSAYGPARLTLDQVAADLGGSWTIQDGQLWIVTDLTPIDPLAVVLNSETGLVGAVKVQNGGIEATSLLQTQLVPGRVILVTSAEAVGSYRAQEVKHTGDKEGAVWTSTVKAKDEPTA